MLISKINIQKLGFILGAKRKRKKISAKDIKSIRRVNKFTNNSTAVTSAVSAANKVKSTSVSKNVVISASQGLNKQVDSNPSKISQKNNERSAKYCNRSVCSS